MTDARRVLELTEYVEVEWARDELHEALGEALWRNFGPQVDVEFPSPKTSGRWRLTAKGWVGFIPLTPEVGLALRPKVPVQNLFRMLEYAYQLESLRMLDGVFDCGSLQELYERLALVLARRALDRVRRGLHRSYEPFAECLPYVRGRLDMRRFITAPWQTELHCRFEEHTADIAINQVVLWALHVVARSGICTERVLPVVRRAHRALQGSVSLVPWEASACTNRRYDRLTLDYEQMHALSRFLLEHCGPQHVSGDCAMVPFLLDMSRLFERFVAEWLRAHLPASLALRTQEALSFGHDDDVRFIIDLVITEAVSGKARCVLDTKYKNHDSPSSDDLAQIVAYAQACGTHDAVLIYPVRSGRPWNGAVGDVRVRALAFPLDGDVDAAGKALLAALLR